MRQPDKHASIDAAIYSAAGLPWPLPADVARVVHEYDIRMCRTERDARLAIPPQEWADCIENAEPVEGCDLYSWSEDIMRIYYENALWEMLTMPTHGNGVRY